MAKNEENEVRKWTVFRTTMRGIGTTLISAGVGLIITGNYIVGALGILLGLVVLGIKDYFEEKEA